MAVAQAHKTLVKEVTRAQSIALMKNLTRAALSEGEREGRGRTGGGDQHRRPPTSLASRAAPHAPRTRPLPLPLVRAPVCFLRNLFPSDCFRTTSFGNTTIRALCPREVGADGRPQGKVLNEDAALLTAWQESAFDALEKGYLRCVRRAVGGRVHAVLPARHSSPTHALPRPLQFSLCCAAPSSSASTRPRRSWRTAASSSPTCVSGRGASGARVVCGNARCVVVVLLRPDSPFPPPPASHAPRPPQSTSSTPSAARVS
jgi:hypothetical protein